MSAPMESAAPASTPAPSAPSAPSSPSSSHESVEHDPGARASARAGIDPNETWEQYRARKSGKSTSDASADADTPKDTPRVTPDKMRDYIAQRKAEREAAEADADPEKGDAAATTARAKDDVQKIAAEATAKTAPDPEAPKPAREFKVKVRGQEIPVPLDKYAALVKLKPETVEYIAEHEGEHAAAQLYQRLHAGDEARREHGTLKSDVERAFSGLKSNTLDALDFLASRPETSFDLLDAAYQIVQRDIDLKAMTPEARRLREVEKQLNTMKAREQAETRERERVLREAHETAERNRVATFRQNYEREIMGAIADAKLPADDYHFGLIHQRLLADMQRDGEAYREPTTPAEMRARAAAHIPAVKEQIRQALKAVYGNPDPETVKAFVADLPELHEASAKERVREYRRNRDAQAKRGDADNARGEKTTAPKANDTWLADLRRRA